jgi:hypothetical protein
MIAAMLGIGGGQFAWTTVRGVASQAFARTRGRRDLNIHRCIGGDWRRRRPRGK